MEKTQGRKNYHHGDARNALISAAGDLLEDLGAAGLSLRQVAERAGLSRQAPYNHFADKEALLAELVRSGYERLAAAAREMSGDHSGEVALSRTAEAYIEFAQELPALFRLMFSRELVDLSRSPPANEAAAAAFGVLSAVVATMVEGDRVDELSLAAWCLIHGYATLCNETGLEPPSARKTRARQFARLIGCQAGRCGG